MSSEPQRLQKVMAHAGIASRRHCEELILAGRVWVNGELVTELGRRVRPGVDRVELNGRPVGAAEDHIYLLLNKPKGYVTTLFDPQGRPKVTDLLGDVGSRVYPVGRLDFDSEGLLLLTNDGELANGLMHPSHQVTKTYVARVRGILSDRKLRDLAEGVELEDGPTAPAKVRLLKTLLDRSKPHNQAADVEITIHEGRNRQVRRMFAAVGHEVITLRRVRFGPLQLEGLAPGHHRLLDDRELRALQQALGLSATNPAAAKAARLGRRMAEAPAEEHPGRPSGPDAEAPMRSPEQGRARPQRQPPGEGQARPQRQPRGEGQARPQRQPPGEGQARPQRQPRGEGQARPQRQPRSEGQARPQRQPRGEGQARPRMQPRADGPAKEGSPVRQPSEPGYTEPRRPALRPGQRAAAQPGQSGQRRPDSRRPNPGATGAVGAPAAGKYGTAKPHSRPSGPRPAPLSRPATADAKARPRIVKLRKTSGKAPPLAPARSDRRK